MVQPRLTRNREQGMLAGVCAGLGDYFVLDPVIVRLVFVLVFFTSMLTLPLYLLLWLVMPRRPAPPAVTPPHALQHAAPTPLAPHQHYQHRRNWRTLGYVLLGTGSLILLQQLAGWSLTVLLPLLMVGTGVVLLVRRRQP